MAWNLPLSNGKSTSFELNFMPLLAQEPYLYPSDLFGDFSPGERDCHWWVLHTKPRVEKTLARQLLRREVSFFLPQYKKVWRNRSRSFQSHSPLFPGYLFLYGDAEARLKALQTNLVVHVISVAEQQVLANELGAVHRAIEADCLLLPEERLTPGSPVEIVDGPLTGLFGTILRRGASCRFVIEVNLLQQGVSVDIEEWMFRPVSADRARQNMAAY